MKKVEQWICVCRMDLNGQRREEVHFTVVSIVCLEPDSSTPLPLQWTRGKNFLTHNFSPGHNKRKTKNNFIKNSAEEEKKFNKNHPEKR